VTPLEPLPAPSRRPQGRSSEPVELRLVADTPTAGCPCSGSSWTAGRMRELPGSGSTFLSPLRLARGRRVRHWLSPVPDAALAVEEEALIRRWRLRELGWNRG
jgi:hypothetical protein